MGQTRNTVFGGNPVPPSVGPFHDGAASQSSYAAALLVIFSCFPGHLTSKSDPKQLFLGPPKGTPKGAPKGDPTVKLVRFRPLDLIRVGSLLWDFSELSDFSLRRCAPQLAGSDPPPTGSDFLHFPIYCTSLRVGGWRVPEKSTFLENLRDFQNNKISKILQNYENYGNS